MMTFLSLRGLEMRYDASVFHVAIALSESNICTNRSSTLHAFKATSFSGHLHAQLLILKNGRCAWMPRTDGFSSLVTYCQINSPPMDNPGVDHRSSAHFLLSSWWVPIWGPWFLSSVRTTKGLEKKGMNSGSLFFQRLCINWGSVRKPEVTPGISNNKWLNRGD